MQQSLIVKNRLYRRLDAQPVTIGVPWPKGQLRDTAVSLRTADGKPVPVASTVLNRWPDGSVQWTLLDFATDLREIEERKFVVAADGTRSPAPGQPVVSRRVGGGVRVSNGIVDLEIGGPAAVGRKPRGKARAGTRRAPLVRRWVVAGEIVVKPGSLDVVIVDSEGKEYRASWGPRAVSVEHASALRTVVRVDGKHQARDGSTLLDYWLRFTVFASRREVKITHHFRNREEAVPGIKLREMRIEATLGVPAEAERAILHLCRGRLYLCTPLRVRGDLEIYASDTVDIEHYAEKHQPAGVGSVYVRPKEVLNDPEEAKPWFMQNVAFRGMGQERKVAPHLGLCSDRQCVVAFGGNMAGLHPKSLKVQGNVLTYSLWPQWAGELLVRQGAGKTHDFHVTGLPPQSSDFDIQGACLSSEQSPAGPSMPIEIIPDIRWIRSCRVFYVQFLPEYHPKKNFRMERKISHRWMGIGYGSGLTRGYWPAAANGMWNYGDTGPGSNNEEMWFLTCLQDYLRSGRWECAERGIQGCQHMVDVDYVDYSVYPSQHRGMCAHCSEHNNGAAYPSHMWFCELFIAYALTGDPEYRRCALNMCENLLYWIYTPEEFEIVRHDLREAGQPVINFTWAYEFNPDRRYLDACMRIFRDVCLANIRQYGWMTNCPLPNEKYVINVSPYGDYATWNGLFYLWCVTGDEEIRRAFLKEAVRRVREEAQGTTGGGRTTNFNVAAEAYYMSGGDRSWLDRIARPFQMSWPAWEFDWPHDIFMIKLALEHGIVRDEDVHI